MTSDVFDYVVIGAGSAGCAAAGRLSESGRNSVLLLEAGGRDDNIWIHIPVGYGKTFNNEKLTWRFSTEPSPGINGRAMFTPSGRVLGGSSSINGMVYVRGTQEDFDNWRQDGNAGWGYQDVLPFFRKSENQENGADAYHGAGGPLNVSNLRAKNPLCNAFVDSAVAAGFPASSDFNSASQEGVGFFQMTARNGRRTSSAAAFLKAARGRPNLSVTTNAHADRLMIENGRVTGVTYALGDKLLTALARHAVILSAGAVNSPALLQRSGIGRGEWLREAGIDVRHELKGVGSNLHDHLQSRIVLHSRRHPTLNTQSRNPIMMLQLGLQYALFRSGQMTTCGAQSGGFVRSRRELDRPDVMVMYMPFSSMDYRKGLDRFRGFSISSMLLRPESRGTVRVRSANRHDAPVIQPNYLTAGYDHETLVAGLRLARKIAATDPLRSEIDREERPGPDVNSDDELLHYVRQTAGTVYHPVGTCKMGQSADAVVDEKLRLRGLEGLVVADASIMPSIVSAPTNATSIMIGERAAGFLSEAG